MELKRIIRGLQDLKDHCTDMIDKEDPESIWREDVATLDAAIDLIQHAAGDEEEPQTEIQTDLTRLETIIRESERYRLGLLPGMKIKALPVLEIMKLKNPEKEPEKDENCEKTAEKATKPTAQDEKPQEKAAPDEEKPKKTKASNIDDGKISALYKGKRSVKQIAEEMHISEQTVRIHLKALKELGMI